MKRLCNVYIIWIVVLLFIQQFISGCATTVTKDLHKEDLYRQDVQMKEVDLVGQELFKNKCSICHELPDIGAYPYTSEQWSSIIDIMHDTKAAKKFMTLDDTEKIKDYLRRLRLAR